MDLLMELNNVKAFSVGCEIKKKKDLTMEVPINACMPVLSSLSPFFRKTFPKRLVYSVVTIVFGAMIAARYSFAFCFYLNYFCNCISP